MAKPLVYNATLRRRVDLTSALAIFGVAPDEPIAGVGRWFVPGQYVAIGMNNDDRPELGSVRRAMSIASAAQRRDDVEFYIRLVAQPESDNPFTHLLWTAAEGARMYIRTAPTGHFTVDATIGAGDPRLKICVAAGTGLAPFLSMARTEVVDDPGADLSTYVVLHGASYPDDLGYRAELADLVGRNKLHYHGTVSRPRDTGWTGDTGRVEDYFLPGRIDDLEQRIGLPAGGLTPRRAAVYICGLQGTIGQTIIRLVRRGFVPDDRKLRKVLAVPDDVKPTLFFEQYDTTPVVDIEDEALMSRLRGELSEGLARLNG
jgi:ferredoxin--NADP+ reductase